jgi:hypothetical protein
LDWIGWRGRNSCEVKRSDEVKGSGKGVLRGAG